MNLIHRQKAPEGSQAVLEREQEPSVAVLLDLLRHSLVSAIPNLAPALDLTLPSATGTANPCLDSALLADSGLLQLCRLSWLSLGYLWSFLASIRSIGM